MADPSDNVSVEDVIEDLQLHEVILQSLDEQRPDAVGERQEILDAIKTLQLRLARLRGEPSPKSNHQNNSVTPAASSAMLPSAQLDGAYDMSPFDNSPPHWGRDQSPGFPPRPRDLSIRKRRHATESSDDTRPPTKRVQSDVFSPPSSQLAQSTQEDSDEYDGADELRQLLGLDDEDTMLAFRDEQRKAEQWLKERKEQERRDEEYARMLHDGLFERPRDPPRELPQPQSAQSSTSSYYSGASLPFPASPAPTPGPARAIEPDLVDRSRLFPQQHQSPSTAFLRTISDRQPRHLMSNFNANRAPPTDRHAPSLVKQESDDSDLQEITPHDFWARPRDSPFARNGLDKPRSPPALWTPSMGLPHMSSFHKQMGQHSYGSMYPPFPPAPGPSDFSAKSGPGPIYGPNVLQNTMARLNAGRQLLNKAGRSVYGELEGTSSFDSDAISRTLDLGFNNPTYDPLSFNDLYGEGADPKKTAEEIKQLLENIRPDMELSKQNREGTPEALKVSLLEHQKLGLAWMKSMEDSETRGGILADDMGLGKTIQALALMVSRQSRNPERKSNLVIAPVALMQQWKREIERLLRPGRHQLSVFVLHGEKRGTSFRDLKEYDVVLTTFGTLASEYKRKVKYEELHKQSGSSEPLPRQIVNQLPCLGPTSKWHRIIIDEAQCIKNRNTKAALAACQLDSTHRWCMSGTPMMNNVEELHSLLKFLRIRPYSNLERFSRVSIVVVL